MADNRQERYINHLAAMLRCPTVSVHDPKPEDLAIFYEFHKLLKSLFPHLFAVCTVEEHEGNLLLKWPGKSAEHPALFMNHQDVVEPLSGWTHDPFCGEVFDGKLWGRGALDTKGGLWGMLQAADELAEEGYVPGNDIYFESGCNEETTGDGARYFGQVLAQRGIHFSFLLDEGGMVTQEPIPGAKGSFAMVAMGERGTCSLKFTAKSAGGHASAPAKNTPLVRLGKFMAKADSSRVFDVELSPVIQEMLRRLSVSISGPKQKLYANPEKFRDLLKTVMSGSYGNARAMVQTTIAFTMAGGSRGWNVIPAEAWIVGNMRVSNHQGYESSLAAITKLAAKYDISVEVLEAALDTPVSSFTTPQFQAVEKAVEKAFPGITTVPYIMTGASDARFMAHLTENSYHFVPFRIDSQQMRSIHGIDENVDVSTLVPAVDFYRTLMQSV